MHDGLYYIWFPENVHYYRFSRVLVGFHVNEDLRGCTSPKPIGQHAMRVSIIEHNVVAWDHLDINRDLAAS